MINASTYSICSPCSDLGLFQLTVLIVVVIILSLNLQYFPKSACSYYLGGGGGGGSFDPRKSPSRLEISPNLNVFPSSILK